MAMTRAKSKQITHKLDATGAATVNLHSKLGEVVSVKDFGAVGDGVTDDAAAINAACTAVSTLGGGEVRLAAGTFIVGSPIAIPDNVIVRGSGQFATTVKLKASANVNVFEKKSGATGLAFGFTDMTVDGNQANNTQGGVYLVGATDMRGPCAIVERVTITHCRNAVMGSGVKSAFYVGANTWSVIHDVDVVNNDYAQIAAWIGAADSQITGLYVGTNGRSFGATSYGLMITGGGNLLTKCYFGGTQSGPQVWINGGGANSFVDCIVDNSGSHGVWLGTGSVNNKFIGGQIGNSSYSDGGTYYSIFSDTVGGNNIFSGVTIYSNYATAYATNGYKESAGTTGGNHLVGCLFTGTFTSGADGRTATSTTSIVGCKGVDVTNVGTLQASTKLDVRGAYPSSAPSTSSVPLGRFNGGGAISLWAGTYAYQNAWLQSIQDDGSNNVKGLYLNPLGGPVQFSSSGYAVLPGSDNAQTLGSATSRWSVVYAGTGTINTSDEREKQQIRLLTDAEHAVAVKLKSLVRAFKFNDAVQTKGADARIHVGVIAQEVMEAFQTEGLDPMRYAIVCYDEWDAELDDDGNEVRPAGNRYGVRYEELLAFIISSL